MMMFPRVAFALLALPALAAAPAPIAEKLQPIIAAKTNMGALTRPRPTRTQHPGASFHRQSSVSGAALVAGVVAVLL
ncbi:hypothetical protein B0H17DRAFT_714856 [Mycena rosella]|uniref:Uncharacterized protein n=1 Tax=Mycena rosella TaxID=1033263 RepID=A0AAD7DAA6_MYCRO|nr:hypothetical protein B0H17DRAFT_714856 [Mycena rosella]